MTEPRNESAPGVTPRSDVVEVPSGSELRWAYCPSGWAPLMRRTVESLDAAVPGWTLRDSKADFRQLDIYVNLPPEASSAACTVASEAIDAAREESGRLCEFCGASAGVAVVEGWHYTLCAAHAAVIRGGGVVPTAELLARRIVGSSPNREEGRW